jgi:hypothetical protein
MRPARVVERLELAPATRHLGVQNLCTLPPLRTGGAGNSVAHWAHVSVEDITVPSVADWSGWLPVGWTWEKPRDGVSRGPLKLVEGGWWWRLHVEESYGDIASGDCCRVRVRSSPGDVERETSRQPLTVRADLNV